MVGCIFEVVNDTVAIPEEEDGQSQGNQDVDDVRDQRVENYREKSLSEELAGTPE